MARKIDEMQMRELLLQALETERGGIEVYETALGCVSNEALKDEFEKYLEQTREHERVVTSLLESLGLDPEEETPGREVVRRIGRGLVDAMKLAQESAPAPAAEIVATECVVLAETKDHLNWELLQALAESIDGKSAQALADAREEIEDQEDRHLYHTAGWCRELWLHSLGLPAVLPPPEEEKDVSTAIGAARAKQQREEML